MMPLFTKKDVTYLTMYGTFTSYPNETSWHGT